MKGVAVVHAVLLERFTEKWKPVFGYEARQKLEPGGFRRFSQKNDERFQAGNPFLPEGIAPSGEKAWRRGRRCVRRGRSGAQVSGKETHRHLFTVGKFYKVRIYYSFFIVFRKQLRK
jgi:hypothetical protein